MIYLLATVLLNTLISVLFKYFARYRVDELQAIVINYGVCILTGSLFLGYCPLLQQDQARPWLPWAGLMGAGFISVFSLFASLTARQGITTATVANKLSLAIPVLAGLLLYGERLSAWHIAGILLAFPAVWLVAATPATGAVRKHWWPPVLLFAGSGLLDTAMQYVQQRYAVSTAWHAIFSVHVFAAAAVAGLVITLLRYLSKTATWQWRNLAGGILLGVPNFFSIYCFSRMLHSRVLQSSLAIPLNNICILLLSLLPAVLLFRERLSGQRLAGVLLSAGVILLLACG